MIPAFLGVSCALGGLAGTLLAAPPTRRRGLAPALAGACLSGLLCGGVVGLALGRTDVPDVSLWGIACLLGVLAYLAGRFGLMDSGKSGVALGRELFLWVFFF